MKFEVILAHCYVRERASNGLFVRLIKGGKKESGSRLTKKMVLSQFTEDKIDF